jgi:hypothetical protein
VPDPPDPPVDTALLVTSPGDPEISRDTTEHRATPDPAPGWVPAVYPHATEGASTARRWAAARSPWAASAESASSAASPVTVGTVAVPLPVHAGTVVVVVGGAAVVTRRAPGRDTDHDDDDEHEQGACGIARSR